MKEGGIQLTDFFQLEIMLDISGVFKIYSIRDTLILRI